jgi:hypothetical protein
VPPDVRRGFAPPSFGIWIGGYAHGSGSAQNTDRARPVPGAQPSSPRKICGGAEPRLTSGGTAVSIGPRCFPADLDLKSEFRVLVATLKQ